jgi:hypothetical protein
MSTTTAAIALDPDQQAAVLQIGNRLTWDTGNPFGETYNGNASMMIEHADALTTAAYLTLAARAGALPPALHDRVRVMLPTCLDDAREHVADARAYSADQQQDDAEVLAGLESLAVLLAEVTS